MRSATAGELATIARLEKVVTVRIKVANGSGTLIDLTNWLEAWSIDHDIDQPVGGATFSFSRAHGTTQSLAPLREDSILNVDDAAAYAPILDLNRIVTFEVATTNIGAVVLSTDYKMLFKGTIDVVNFEKTPISIECRDEVAPMVDRWIEAPAFYGTTPVGTPIQDVMVDINDDTFGAGLFPLYFDPADPAFDIIKYSQQIMSVMDAQMDLAQLRALDVRSLWDDGTSAFRVTVWEPDRTKTVPDHEFGPSKYIDITRLNLDLTNIRNAVIITFREGNLGNRGRVEVVNAASITKFKRRVLILQEPDVSPIDSSAEATVMANGALSDLKEPKAEQEVEMPLFWPCELGDLYRFTDNSVHYNVPQDLAVVEIRHSGSRNSHRTNIKVRGSVAGQYLTWIGRGGGGPGSGGAQAFPPILYIVPLNTETNEVDWDLQFYASYGSGGGGANLTYTITTKAFFGTEVTISSGNASAFPLDLTVPRNISIDTLITFRVTDAATGMRVQEMFTLPMFNTFIDTGTGDVDADFVQDGALQRTVPFTVLTVNNDLAVRKVKGTGSAPSLSNVHVFWNGTNSITGTDTAGLVTLNKTATPATQTNATQFKVNFAVAYAATPNVVLSNSHPFGSGAGGDFLISAVTTTDFTVSMANATLLASGAALYTATFNYVVIG